MSLRPLEVAVLNNKIKDKFCVSLSYLYWFEVAYASILLSWTDSSTGVELLMKEMKSLNVWRLLWKLVFEFYWVWFLQSQWRMVLAQRFLNQTRERLTAALQIQRAWRSHKASAWYRKLRSGIVIFQAHIRGYLARRRFKEAKRSQEEEVRSVTTSDLKVNHFLHIAIFLPVKFRIEHIF